MRLQQQEYEVSDQTPQKEALATQLVTFYAHHALNMLPLLISHRLRFNRQPRESYSMKHKKPTWSKPHNDEGAFYRLFYHMQQAYAPLRFFKVHENKHSNNQTLITCIDGKHWQTLSSLLRYILSFPQIETAPNTKVVPDQA